MIRNIHCPHCNEINELEGLTKGIKEVSKGLARGGETYSCRDCGWKFAVIETYEKPSNHPLFQIAGTFRIDPHISDPFTTIPFEHDREIEFQYDIIVREGPEIEILFLEETELSHLRENQRFRVFSELCKQDILQDQDSGTLPTGRHRMVLRENGGHDERILLDYEVVAYGL